jgi:hypothetical protein
MTLATMMNKWLARFIEQRFVGPRFVDPRFIDHKRFIDQQDSSSGNIAIK